MKTFFIFFSICIVSAFAGASTPWLIRKWENKIVPFSIHSTFDKKQRQIILAAMMEVEDNTCISFIPRQLQKDYILFKKLDHGSICSSIIGRQVSGGRQHVNLTDECVVRNTLLHELMHILGFHHEHSRHDRDKYIEINLNHVRPKHKEHLKFVRKVDPLDLNRPYDYKSITHYPADVYSMYPNGITIRSKSPWFKIKADGLSDIDIWKIKYMYNCSNEGESVESSNEHAEMTTTNVPNIRTATVDQQRRYQNETNTSQRTTTELSTNQSRIKQVQTTSSITITETSIGTASTTTRPISILNKEIIKAVREGNEIRVEQLLNEGADVNARKIGEYQNKTLLHIATEKGHENVVALVLDKGANIEAKDVDNSTPLHHAAQGGDVNVVSLLLDKGANIEAKDTLNWTPLHRAAFNGHADVVSLLLNKGANIEARSTSNLTPLHYAAVNGQVNVISLLVEKGANIEAKDVDNSTPLHHAVRGGDVNVVSLLLDKGANIEAKDTLNWTPLHRAAWNGHANVVSLLLNKGANIEARSTSNWTPLHYAAVNGHVNVVSLILKKGANIEAKDLVNSTSLHHAVRGGHVNVVSLLLNKGANIEARSTSNWTPLHYAAVNGHGNVISLLLEEGANIEAKDLDNSTPLHHAVRGGHVNVVSLLLDKSANIEAKEYLSNFEFTPLDLANQRKNEAIVKILKRKQRQLITG